MLDIQKTAIVKLVSALDGVKAQYKIILPDGTEYGTLEVKPSKVIKEGSKASPYPRGELKAYVTSFIGTLPVGEAAVVPYGRYEGVFVAASCSSTAHALWGSESYMCARKDHNNCVEVLRLK
jgi:hypothetical protein